MTQYYDQATIWRGVYSRQAFINLNKYFDPAFIRRGVYSREVFIWRNTVITFKTMENQCQNLGPVKFDIDITVFNISNTIEVIRNTFMSI